MSTQITSLPKKLGGESRTKDISILYNLYSLNIILIFSLYEYRRLNLFGTFSTVPDSRSYSKLKDEE